MRLQDFFNLVDEDRSGRLTPNELMQASTADKSPLLHSCPLLPLAMHV